MCSVSMITDHWMQKKALPSIAPSIYPWNPGPIISIPPEEFYRLKAEVEELKEELKKARAKDIEEDVGDCEMKDSVILLKELAEKLGVDLEDVLDGHKE